MSLRRLVLPALAALLAAPALPAQPLARRVAAAPDGEVRITFPTRRGVCGDGRDVVAIGGTLYVYPDVETHGRWSGVRCEPGAARVALAVRGGAVEGVRVRVGDQFGDGGARGPATSIGPVAAQEAADFLLAVAARGDRRAARQALLGAVIADGADVQPGLLRLARDGALDRETRRHAIGWLGEVGDSSLVPTLVGLAREEESGVSGSAVYALARLEDDAGLPSLVAFARSASAPLALRRHAVFWLGQSDARRARETVRAVVQDADAPDELRAHAVFALGHGDAATAEDVAFLQRLFPTLASRKMRDQVLMAVGRSGAAGRRWALERARDASLDAETRKQALFWAEQGGVPTAELIATYEALDDRQLREHALFVLSRRDETAARDKLLAIARSDADRGLRRTALFWLTQKHDPRAERLIAELLGK